MPLSGCIIVGCILVWTIQSGCVSLEIRYLVFQSIALEQSIETGGRGCGSWWCFIAILISHSWWCSKNTEPCAIIALDSSLTHGNWSNNCHCLQFAESGEVRPIILADGWFAWRKRWWWWWLWQWWRYISALVHPVSGSVATTHIYN